MSSVVTFETINGMLDALLGKYSGGSRPIMMWKSGGAYAGIGYREFGEQVWRIAAGLASLGVEDGDRVAIISENRPEWVVADMAMIRLGAVNVSLYPSLTPKQIGYILNDAGVACAIVSNRLQYNKVAKVRAGLPCLKHIVTFADLGADAADAVSFADLALRGDTYESAHPGAVRARSAAVTPDHLLTLIYTSGTTGNPKGVMLTHRNLVSNILASTECIPFLEDDVLLSFLPLCHSYERMAGYYSAMSCGVTIAYAESIDTVRENLLEVRPTIVTTVPRLFERIYNGLMKQSRSLPPLKRVIFGWAMSVRARAAAAPGTPGFRPILRLERVVADRLVFAPIRRRLGGRIRFFVSGGAALPRELGEFFGSIGIGIIEGYGMTESSPVISVNRPGSGKFGTVGSAIPGVTVRIAEDGEILVKGPNVMRGYWNDPVATAEVIDADGWLHTGDIGRFDPDGFLVITDRKKHIIVNSGGKNIAPGPLESAFLGSGLIHQIVIIGDGRVHLSALVVPEYDHIRERLAAEGNPAGSGPGGLPADAVRRLIQEEIDLIQKDFAPFERIRKFTLMPKAFSLEEGEITPTMKVRRGVVEKKYRETIERMYEGVV
jgi:long-chain acyl-CoA synthetase